MAKYRLKLFTMKKLILGIAAVATFTTASAQHRTTNVYPENTAIEGKTGFYVSVQGGYNLPIAGQTLMVDEDFTGASDSYDDVMGTFGKGANFGVGLGYMLTPNLGAELGFNYLLGAEYTATSRSSLANVTQKMRGNMVQISPSVVLRTNQSGPLNHYVKAGLLIGVGSKVTEEWNATSGTNYAFSKEEYTGNASLGFTGAVGLDYAVNNRISLFGEIKGNALTYKPKESEYVQASINGVDQLPNMTTRDRYTVYLDSYVDDGTANEADQQSRISMPFSSIGVNVGLRFKF